MQTRTPANMQTLNKSSDSLELKELFNTISLNRKILYKSAAIAFLVGVFFIIFTPRLYKTELSLLAESGSKSPASGLLGQLGGLSGLDMGSLIGLDMGGSGSVALTPDLYPEVVKSTTFLVEILQQEVYFPKKDITITVSKYLQDHTKPSIAAWPGYILNLFKSKEGENLIQAKVEGEPFNLSQTHIDLIKSLSNTIELSIIKTGGGLTGGKSKIIKVSIELQDPYISALLAEKVIASLKHYIINYHTGKAKKDLEFIEARYTEAQIKYYQTQQILADYEDSNVNVILASTKMKLKRLETENTLASNIYKGLAQKLEQSRILVQDKTPVFTVIEPAKIPLRKSKPKTIFTIISLSLIGLFIGTCIILGKEFIMPFFKNQA